MTRSNGAAPEHLERVRRARLARNRGSSSAPRPIDTLTLDHASRHVRRTVLSCDGGTRIAIDLPEATRLRDGDRLALDSNDEVLVRAASEPLMEVVARGAAHLAELAWHVGNRHALARVEADRILIAHDPVLARMLEGLGATVAEIDAPFEPLRGAYHSHDHAHPDDLASTDLRGRDE